MIPHGHNDLYILKSEIVPPVCPVCPSTCPSSSKKEKCPPCPACARCKEPSFECKKVPNYSSNNGDSGAGNYFGFGQQSTEGDDSGDHMPVPVLNNFSTFGM